MLTMKKIDKLELNTNRTDEQPIASRPVNKIRAREKKEQNAFQLTRNCDRFKWQKWSGWEWLKSSDRGTRLSVDGRAKRSHWKRCDARSETPQANLSMKISFILLLRLSLQAIRSIDNESQMERVNQWKEKIKLSCDMFCWSLVFSSAR